MVINVNKIKTKKYKKNKNRKTIKYNQNVLTGGNSGINNSNSVNNDVNNDVNNNNSVSNILEKVKEERKPNIDLGNVANNILQNTSTIAKGIAVNALDNIGSKIGIDVSNPNAVNQKLNQINNALTDNRNIEQMKNIVSNASQLGAIALESAKPFVDPLIDKVIDSGTKAAKKIGESSVKIALNTAEEIPGVGILIGTARSLSNAGEAMLATGNALSEVATSTSDTVNASMKNFKRLIREKNNVLNRTAKSFNSFNQLNTNTPVSALKKYSNINDMNSFNNFNNFNNNKTKKRVRFQL